MVKDQTTSLEPSPRSGPQSRRQPDPVKVKGYSQYGAVAVGLHWLIALGLFAQIVLGWRMGDDSQSRTTYLAYQLHKSLGITILLLSLLRLAWRLSHRPPPLEDHLKAWEKALAHLTHFGFYVIMIGLPLTGWLIVSTSRTHIPTLIYGQIPWPDLPFFQNLSLSVKHGWNKLGEESHKILVKLTYGLLLLHIGGALKHQLIDRDVTLSRMLPQWPIFADLRPYRRLILPLILPLLVIGCGFGFGAWVFRGASEHQAQPDLSQTDVGANPALATPLGPKPAAIKPTQATAANPSGASLKTKPESIAPESTQDRLPLRHFQLLPTSRLDFETKWSGQSISGHFKAFAADIVFSPNDLDHSHVKVTIDLSHIDTGDAQRDATLATEDWFASETFPKAVFETTRLQKTGSRTDSDTGFETAHYRADGLLHLKGVTKPVRLDFQLTFSKPRHPTRTNKALGEAVSAKVIGTAIVNRNLFGIGQGDYANQEAIPWPVLVVFQLDAVTTADPPDKR